MKILKQSFWKINKQILYRQFCIDKSVSRDINVIKFSIFLITKMINNPEQK